MAWRSYVPVRVTRGRATVAEISWFFSSMLKNEKNFFLQKYNNKFQKLVFCVLKYLRQLLCIPVWFKPFSGQLWKFHSLLLKFSELISICTCLHLLRFMNDRVGKSYGCHIVERYVDRDGTKILRHRDDCCKHGVDGLDTVLRHTWISR